MGRGMENRWPGAKPFLLVAAALKARGQGCFPGLAGLLGTPKGMLAPGKASVPGSGSQWSSSELVEKRKREAWLLVSAVPACHLDRSWSLLLPTRWG